MEVVDELAPALGHLPGKEAIKRKAATADPDACVIEVRPDPVHVELVSAGEARQTGAHNGNSHGRIRLRARQVNPKGRGQPSDRADHGQLTRCCEELTPARAPRSRAALYGSVMRQPLTR